MLELNEKEAGGKKCIDIFATQNEVALTVSYSQKLTLLNVTRKRSYKDHI